MDERFSQGWVLDMSAFRLILNKMACEWDNVSAHVRFPFVGAKLMRAMRARPAKLQIATTNIRRYPDSANDPGSDRSPIPSRPPVPAAGGTQGWKNRPGRRQPTEDSRR